MFVSEIVGFLPRSNWLLIKCINYNPEILSKIWSIENIDNKR